MVVFVDNWLLSNDGLIEVVMDKDTREIAEAMSLALTSFALAAARAADEAKLFIEAMHGRTIDNELEDALRHIRNVWRIEKMKGKNRVKKQSRKS